jgi:uncharacterized membrane protein
MTGKLNGATQLITCSWPVLFGYAQLIVTNQPQILLDHEIDRHGLGLFTIMRTVAEVADCSSLQYELHNLLVRTK